MQNKNGAGLAAGGGVFARERGAVNVRPKLIQTVECFGPDGELKWREVIENLTTTAGLNDMVQNYWKGSGYTASFFVGLKGSGTIAAGDTMASHAGWSEATGYSEANRQALTLGTVSAGAADNSASKAVFSINATATIAGAFVTTNNTKGGTTGTLIGASDFASARSVLSGDTLNVQINVSFT